MIDTISAYTGEFSLNPNDNQFQKQTTVDNLGEIKGEKLYCNKIQGINFDIKIDLQGREQLYSRFSAPKLLYGTSLKEIQTNDFDKLKKILLQKYKKAGINLPNNFIDNLLFSRIDFCKNIQVEQYIPDYLKTFGNFNISRKQKSTYKGETLLFRNKSHEFTFYNKIREIKDTEKNDIILNMVRDKDENILRIESRLKKKSVIEKQIKGIQKLKLENLFSIDMSKDNLLTHYNKLVSEDEEKQLEFNFENTKEIVNKLKEKHTRDIDKHFIMLVGFDNFFNHIGNDWELFRTFLIDVCGMSRAQSYVKQSSYKEMYESFLVTPDEKDLIKEVREKIEAWQLIA